MFGAGHGEERTRNMYFMLVTLEVSKASGWLNADALCRESQGGHIRCGVRVRASSRASTCRGGARLQIGGRAHGEERT